MRRAGRVVPKAVLEEKLYGIDDELGSNAIPVHVHHLRRKLIDSAPFPDAISARPGRLGVCFFHKDPSWPRAYRDYRGPERMTMLSNHLIIDYGEPSLVTRLTVEKTVGARMTQRNWSSILRIAAVVEGM